MKKLFLVLITFLLVCIFFSKEEKNRIAILTPVTHPSLEQIETAFKQKIETEYPGKYKFVTYNAQGNKSLMRGEVEEILEKNYDLVFTIGTSASQMVKEVFSKKGAKRPVVFTCVNDPLGFEIHGSFITGVKEMIDYEKEIDLVIQERPDIKRVLLVFNPMEPGLLKDKKSLEEIFEAKKLELIAVEVFQTNEILKKVEPLVKEVDAILVLKDNTVIRGIEALIKVGNKNQIPLIASDLDSPDLGAAFAYGVEEKEFGLEGAKKALEILEEHKDPSSIPVTSVDKFIFKVGK
jgi:putative ABC transport system substrate-binding protein